MDIEENGVISIVAPDALSAQAAKTMIRGYTTVPQVGEIYLGRVSRIVDFGVFIELRPGVDGLCHISQLDDKRIENIEEVVKTGDEVIVKIIDIDKQGRIKLSRRDAFGLKPTFS
jgi:polyribonucleotide nucleotidyltransferase